MFDKKPANVPIVYSDSYYVEIGDHVFPTSKYKLIKSRLEKDEDLSNKFAFFLPVRAKDEDVILVHTAEYVDKLKNCKLDLEEISALEMPLSKELVDAALITCGGTITTGNRSLDSGVAVHLGGGFHHAFPDHGEGFCVLNDIAVCIRALQKEKRIEKALIIDCDLHQGNGTAFIFKDDPTVFTFSLHQQNNYPFNKPESNVDIGLLDYTSDKVYLEHLSENIPKIISSFKPDIILYLAGADPYKDDQLGGLSLTKKGLRERDNFVCTQALNFDVPIAITLAGGYAHNREDTVDIHFGTITECIKVFVGL